MSSATSSTISPTSGRRRLRSFVVPAQAGTHFPGPRRMTNGSRLSPGRQQGAIVLLTGGRYDPRKESAVEPLMKRLLPISLGPILGFAVLLGGALRPAIAAEPAV